MIVLNELEKKARIQEIASRPHKFTVLDTSHIRHLYNTSKFSLAIELLNICNTLNWGNEIISKVNPDKQVKLDIFYTALNAIIKDQPFTNNQLLEYFKAKKEIERFALLLSNFTDLQDNLWYPEIDLILLGLSLKEQEELKNLQNQEENIYSAYADIYDRFNDNGVDLQKFIKESQSQIEQERKQIPL